MSESESDNSRRRLEDVLDQVIEHGAETPLCGELSRLIDSKPELLGEIADQLRIHSLLEWQSHDAATALSLSDLEAEPELLGDMRTPRTFRPSRRGRWLAAAALMLASGLGLAAYYVARPASDAVVAEVVDDAQVAWSESTDAVADRKEVGRGLIEFESGTLTLRFRSGATLRTIGPASMRIDSDMLVYLDGGQATAHVPQWARGFTVETPDAHIVDMGTKFGVVARSAGKTDVVVFDGEVHVRHTAREESGEKLLFQGEAVRVDSQGMDRIVQVRRDSRGQGWSTGPSDSDIGVIGSIHDNLRSSNSPKYYEVTPHGLDDDVLAYVDRPHQWNGIDGTGLPRTLRHADYVRTFNEDKYTGELEITVELLEPAMLYILFDNRVPAPEWLKADFKDTGEDIGLDEGPWAPGDPALRTTAGSGNSVDSVFSVWERRCDEPGPVRLGPVGPSIEARAMYGIAARAIGQIGADGPAPVVGL